MQEIKKYSLNKKLNMHNIFFCKKFKALSCHKELLQKWFNCLPRSVFFPGDDFSEGVVAELQPDDRLLITSQQLYFPSR